LLLYILPAIVTGLEMHLLVLHKLIQGETKNGDIDPISSPVTVGNTSEVRAMFVRLWTRE
jgi:hypothetical protein